MRVVRLEGPLQPEALQRCLAEAHEQAAKDWAERGWDVLVEKETSHGNSAGRAMTMKDLERRRVVEELHKKMAENLLAAHSAVQAQSLVRRGVVKPKDFVVEDVAVGLDADAAADDAREEHLVERVERETLRAAQAAEFSESQARDANRRAIEEERRAAAQREAEEEEARTIWARMDREHRIERLPQEPLEGCVAEGVDAVLSLTVVLPVSGRKVFRRWRAGDPVNALAEFAFGRAEDAELPYGQGPPRLVCTFPRREFSPDDTRSLQEVGLSSREVLHAIPAA